MRPVIRISLLCLWLCGVTGARAVGADDSGDFRPLFNGRDLSGWVPVNTAPSTWSVKDGMLICSGQPTGELRTDRMYQNFVMELEWRHMVPRGNAGVFVWADDITARGVPFHRSIEVQVLENAYGNTRSHTTHGDIFPIHGAKMVPINGRGGSRAFPTESRSKPSPEWNHYRITCNDGDISLAVNGKVVTRGRECIPRKGYICLESEGGIVHYRNIRIRPLPDTPIDPDMIAIADRGYRSLYTGVDLSGWKVGGEKWAANNWVLSCTGSTDDPERALTSDEQFSDFGFLFDVRLKPNSGASRVLLRGVESIEIPLSPDSKLVADALQKPGSWNRFEGTLQGNRLTLKLNGQSVIENRAVETDAARGPIKLIAAGPIDFANIFVRKLE